ncbi:MAG: hypothetical protein RI955_1733 [Bacteroidota bacterium]
MTELEDNIRSEEVQEIMERMPRKFILWGTSFIVGIILMLVFLSAIIQYPDIINGSAEITSFNPPASIIAKSTGSIQQIFIADKNEVTAEQVIAIIKNPADFKQILLLDSLLKNEAFEKINHYAFWKKNLNTFNQLGEVNMAFANYLNALNDFEFSTVNKINLQQSNRLLQQAEMQANQQLEIKNQYNNALAQFQLKQNQYNEQKKLYDEKIIAKKDWDAFQTEYLQLKNQVENYELSIKNNQLQNSQLTGQAKQMQQTFQKELNDKGIQVFAEKEQLKSAIITWKEKYVLKSPMNGVVTFQNFWSANQLLNAGDEFCKIVSNENKIICKAYVPMIGSAKIKTNQKARLVFLNYPENEFGFVDGSVENISLVTARAEKEKVFVVTVSIPNPIITSLKKELKTLPEMQATVEIITERKSILKRLTDNWLNNINKQKE